MPRSNVTIELIGRDSPASPYSGENTVTRSISQDLADGSSDNQVNRIYGSDFTVGTSSTTNLDLQTATDMYGTALGLEDMCVMDIQNDGPADITVEEGSSNGWTNFVDGAIKLPSGSGITVRAFAADVLAISGTNKVLAFVNADGAQTAAVKVRLFGRDSS